MTEFATMTTNIATLTKEQLQQGFGGCGVGLNLTANNFNAVFKKIFGLIDDIDLDQAKIAISEDGKELILTNEDNTESKVKLALLVPAIVAELCPNVDEREADTGTAKVLFCDKDGIGKSESLYKKIATLSEEIDKLKDKKTDGFILFGNQLVDQVSQNDGYEFGLLSATGDHSPIITRTLPNGITGDVVFTYTLPIWITDVSDISLRSFANSIFTDNPSEFVIDIANKLLVLTVPRNEEKLPYSKVYVNYKGQ